MIYIQYFHHWYIVSSTLFFSIKHDFAVISFKLFESWIFHMSSTFWCDFGDFTWSLHSFFFQCQRSHPITYIIQIWCLFCGAAAAGTSVASTVLFGARLKYHAFSDMVRGWWNPSVIMLSDKSSLNINILSQWK